SGTLSITVDSNVYVLGTDAALASNGDTWTLDLTGTTLADGTYAVNAKVTDTAGNSSEANQDVVIDTTAPNDEPGPDGGALPDVAISRITDDTGTLTSDFITNDNTLKIQGQWSQGSG
ncbi:hypothetical protein CWC28_21670, partial [Pseudoalteromonas sp. S4492]|uniref:Ig-like domain-containing protein n=1 Tax=Pseudoalteromonas sp. S4492 TaxID=579560 RepID=UPI00126B735D